MPVRLPTLAKYEDHIRPRIRFNKSKTPTFATEDFI